MNFRRIFVACSILGFLASIAAPIEAQCLQWNGEFRRAGFDRAVTSLLSDGSTLYAGGWFSSVAGTPAYRLGAWNGTTWQPVAGGMNDSVDAMTTFNDGSGSALYAGGVFTSAGGVSANYIARFDGSVWSALGAGVGGRVLALASFDDGSGPALYVGGYFSTAGGLPAIGLARWRNSVWSSIGDVTAAGGNGFVNVLRVHDDGSGPQLYAGGSFDSVNGVHANGVARWNGTSWSRVGAGFDTNGPVNAFTVYDAGSGPRLIAGGSFVQSGGVVVNRVAAWDGTSWSPIGTGIDAGVPYALVNALVAHDDGSGPALYASGSFNGAGGVPAHNVARWNGSSWASVGASVPSLYDNQSGRALAVYVEHGAPQLFMGGHFILVGDAYVNYLGRWDGTSWSPVGPANAPHMWARALHAHDDGSGAKLYAGGEFEGIGDVWARHVAAWDGTRWQQLGEGLDQVVNALATFDDGSGPALIAGGAFTASGSLPLSRLAKWNGSAWSALPGVSGLQGSVLALLAFDDGTGPALYVGGSLDLAAAGIHDIARWKNGVLAPLGSGMASPGFYPSVVESLAAWDDGTGTKVFAGGRFDTAGGVPAVNIARWDGASWSALAGGLPGDPFSASVRDLEVWRDANGSALVAAGSFTAAGSISNLAQWNGTTWSSLGGVNGPMYELQFVDEGAGEGAVLLAGGLFSSIGGASTRGIAKWNGVGWAPLGSGLDGPDMPAAFSIGVLDDGAGNGLDVYVSGQFASAGGVVSESFARWKGCEEVGRDYCFGDGSGTPCPCGNASAPSARAGCTNSFGLASALRGSGQTSLAHDTLVLTGSAMPNAAAQYFQGTTATNGGAGVVMGDGLRCAGGAVVRLATKTNVAGTSHYPAAGDAPIAAAGGVAAPGVRRYQVWYRNSAAFCTPQVFNLTNGVEIVWTP